MESTSAPTGDSSSDLSVANLAQEVEQEQADSGTGEVSLTQTKQAQPNQGQPVEKHKLKIDGKDVEVTLDELKKNYSLGTAAEKRMKEAAELKKATERAEQKGKTLDAMIDRLEKDPEFIFDVLKELKHDPKELSQRWLYKQFEYDNLSPEQKRLRELEEKDKRWTKEEEERSKLDAEQKASERRSKMAESMDSELSEFMQDVPKVDPVTLGLMINFMEDSLKAGKDCTWKDAYDRMHAHGKKLTINHLTSLTKEDIATLPKAFLDLVRQADLANVQSQVVPGRKLHQPAHEKQSAPRQPPKKMGFNEYFDNIDKRYGLK